MLGLLMHRQDVILCMLCAFFGAVRVMVIWSSCNCNLFGCMASTMAALGIRKLNDLECSRIASRYCVLRNFCKLITPAVGLVSKRAHKQQFIVTRKILECIRLREQLLQRGHYGSKAGGGRGNRCYEWLKGSLVILEVFKTGCVILRSGWLRARQWAWAAHCCISGAIMQWRHDRTRRGR